MAESFADVPGGARVHAGDRRALRRRDRARQPADPALRHARTARPRRRTCARWSTRACASATATRCPPRPSSAMEMELGVIDKMGFNAYFLIVWDFVDYAKDNGIAVGPGRGSAAGSHRRLLRCEITDVDPLRYDLLFERFLNAERVSMPDIDIDFSVRGRERVIRYVTEKYGAESRGADHHLRQDVPARGHARRRARARPRLRRRRPAGQADPGPDHGPPAELRGLPAAGRRARRRGRARPDRQADRRRRAGPRGHRPQRVDPRRRGRDLRPPADRHRAAAARRRRHGARTARRSTGRSRSSR